MYSESIVEQYSFDDFMQLIHVIREKKLWFKQLEIENRINSKMLLVRFKDAIDNMQLSEEYHLMMEKQLSELHEKYINPLTNYIHSNFIVYVNVDTKGRFLLQNVQVEVKVDCPKADNLIKTFKKVFDTLLPFALNISELKFRGHKHRITVVETMIKITSEELDEIVNDPVPIISPLAEKQWYSIANMVYQQASRDYYYNIEIPCIEGELYWSKRVHTVQVSMFKNSRNYYRRDLNGGY